MGKLSSKKIYIHFSRQLAKYICFGISFIIIAIYLVVTANKVLGIVKNNVEESSNRSAEILVHEYSLILEQYFNGMFAELKQISHNISDVDFEDEEKVLEWLKNNKTVVFNEFSSIICCDINGNGYVSNGRKIDLSKTESFILAKNENKERLSIGPLISAETEELSLIFIQSVKDINGNLKGFVGSSISLDVLSKKLIQMKIENDGRFFVIGDNGKFICHQSEFFLGKEFTPKDSRYKKISTNYLLTSGQSKFESVSTDGEEVTIYTKPILGTKWLCGVTVSKAQMLYIYRFLNSAFLQVVVITILLIVILITASAIILNSSFLNEIYYDELTNLWKRAKFEKESQKILDKSRDDRFVVFEMDFRGFKFINQGIGKKEADDLLCTCATILLEECKRVNFICGRGYADHFYVMGKIESVPFFMEWLNVLVINLEKELEYFDIPSYFKIGITFVLPDITFYSEKKTIQELIAEATFAKGTIKERVLQSYAIYSKKMREQNERVQRIERNMLKALSSGEFIVVYQPKISLADDKIKGAEALVRWNSSNPSIGYLTPADFMSIFEQNGFIIQLDFAVYEMVFKFLRRQLDLGNPVVPISVNMSRNHSNPDKFVNEFISKFEKYDLPPSLIEVEILERAAEESMFNLVAVTEKLHAYGFSVAMDDFGSGQSSLSMLDEVPIDVLKFDQNFLRNSKNCEEHDKMINILINLGKQLNKKTLFEGVETQEQRDMLKELNCDQVQGYFYSKPLDEADFVDFVKEHL